MPVLLKVNIRRCDMKHNSYGIFIIFRNVLNENIKNIISYLI